MAQQERPPRSLRKGGDASRYSRDWESASKYLPPDESEFVSEEPLEPQEMNMLEDIAEDEIESSSVSSESQRSPVAGPLPELNVIVPDLPVLAPEPEKEKPKVTRVKPKIQRARRRSEIQKEEMAQAETEKRQKEIEVELDKPTVFSPKEGPDTSLVQENIKDISTKLDETKENVKNTAENISENIKQVSDKITDSVVSGVKKVSGRLVGLINKFGSNKSASQPVNNFTDEDFEDDPIDPIESPQSTPVSQPVKAPTLLDNIPPVIPIDYAPMFHKDVRFLTFDKQPMVARGLSDEVIQDTFLSEAIQDIQKCIKVVKKLPDPKEGPYMGIPVSYIFQHVRVDDIYFFLHYVRQKPKSFVGKDLKLSEAFATWILKRSHKTIVAEPFPEIPDISYVPLYKQNIRFLTVNKRQMVLATGKSPQEIDAIFMKNAINDVRECIDLVRQFPSPPKGPYKDRSLALIFKKCSAKDINFFLHYIQNEPEIFQGKNFKFSEAFASWILQHSHETQI